MSKPAATRVRTPADPEITAISKIGRIIAELDRPAQTRVLNFVHAKFCNQAPDAPKKD